MRLRRLTSADTEGLIEFELGAVTSPWVAEVAEIVHGVGTWERDPAQAALDRPVFVLDDEGGIVPAAPPPPSVKTSTV